MQKLTATIIMPLLFILGAFLILSSWQAGIGLAQEQAAVKIINRISDITAREVVNEKGEHLGYSKDLIVGSDGSIDYLIILRGSAFGIIGPLIPIPWSMVTRQEFGKPLVVKVDRDVIRNAPGFTLDKWPDFYSVSEIKKINDYYREYLSK